MDPPGNTASGAAAAAAAGSAPLPISVPAPASAPSAPPASSSSSSSRRRKKKKFNARFPPARIKKIMQTDEEIGKVALAVPVIISRALEMFSEALLTNINELIVHRGAKTITASHLKHCIFSDPRFDFLKNQMSSIPDLQGDEDTYAQPQTPLPILPPPNTGVEAFSNSNPTSSSIPPASVPQAAALVSAPSNSDEIAMLEVKPASPTKPPRLAKPTGTGRPRGRPRKSSQELVSSSGSRRDRLKRTASSKYDGSDATDEALVICDSDSEEAAAASRVSDAAPAAVINIAPVTPPATTSSSPSKSNGVQHTRQSQSQQQSVIPQFTITIPAAAAAAAPPAVTTSIGPTASSKRELTSLKQVFTAENLDEDYDS